MSGPPRDFSMVGHVISGGTRYSFYCPPGQYAAAWHKIFGNMKGQTLAVTAVIAISEHAECLLRGYGDHKGSAQGVLQGPKYS